MSDLNERLLDELAKHLAVEPERPDLDVHIGHHLEAVARRWNEWDRGRAAWRHLLGVRLVNEALEERGVQT